MATPTPKPDIRLLVKVSAESGFGGWTLRIKAIPVTIDADGKLRTFTSDYGPYAGLKDLAIETWRNPGETFMPATTSYTEPYRVTLPDAETMIKTLRRIDSKVRQLSEKYAAPRTFATYAAYVAEALGIKSDHPFLRNVPPEKDYEGTGYKSMTTDSLDYHISSESREFDKAHGSAHAA